MAYQEFIMTNEKSMAQTVKNAGLPSVQHLSDEIDVKRSTLRNWFYFKKKLFNAVLDYASRKYKDENDAKK